MQYLRDQTITQHIVATPMKGIALYIIIKSFFPTLPG
jgi:hypothetical protein